MTDYLFQDTAGTIPAILPGASVARVNRRKGTLDATQATASKRPVLARWPKGGRRNLLPAVETWWKNGVTRTATGDGVFRYVKNTIEQQHRMVSNGIGTTGEIASCRIELKYDGHRFVKLEFPQGTQAFVDLKNGVIASGTGTIVSLDDGWIEYQNTGLVGSYGGVYITLLGSGDENGTETVAGDGVGAILVRRTQFELSAAPTAWQIVTSAYDITESGVDDVYHLVSDGVDDSLPVTLPAGTYGRAWVDNLGAVTIDSLTLSAATDCDLLLGTRVADAIYRQGAFTSAEQAALQSYWEGKYQA